MIIVREHMRRVRTYCVPGSWRLIQRIRFLVMRVSQAQLVGTLMAFLMNPGVFFATK